MQVGYDFTKDGPFKSDYPNLYNRICNLQDIILSYCRTGKLYSVYLFGTAATDAPRILHVSFDDSKAKCYEETIERFLDKRPPRGEISLPLPKFSVMLQLDVCFGVKSFASFDFAIWNDREALINFCEDLKKRRNDVYLSRIR